MIEGCKDYCVRTVLNKRTGVASYQRVLWGLVLASS